MSLVETLDMISSYGLDGGKMLNTLESDSPSHNQLAVSSESAVGRYAQQVGFVQLVLHIANHVFGRHFKPP